MYYTFIPQQSCLDKYKLQDILGFIKYYMIIRVNIIFLDFHTFYTVPVPIQYIQSFLISHTFSKYSNSRIICNQFMWHKEYSVNTPVIRLFWAFDVLNIYHHEIEETTNFQLSVYDGAIWYLLLSQYKKFRKTFNTIKNSLLN